MGDSNNRLEFSRRLKALVLLKAQRVFSLLGGVNPFRFAGPGASVFSPTCVYPGAVLRLGTVVSIYGYEPSSST